MPGLTDHAVIDPLLGIGIVVLGTKQRNIVYMNPPDNDIVIGMVVHSSHRSLIVRLLAIMMVLCQSPQLSQASGPVQKSPDDLTDSVNELTCECLV